MAIVHITHEDLTVFQSDIPKAKAEAMIEDVMARAIQINPAIGADTLTPNEASAAKGIIRRVILRWNDSGTGAITQQSTTAGPYNQSQTIDNRSGHRKLFYVEDIEELKALGKEATSSKGKAFSIDMTASRTLGSSLDPRDPLWFQYGD